MGGVGVGDNHPEANQNRDARDDGFLKNQRHTGAARFEITNKKDISGAFKERSLSSVFEVFDGSSAQS